MKRVTALVAAAIILAVVPSAYAQSAKAQQGAAVFSAQKCAMCHSVAGKGNPKGALDDVGSKLKADDIRAWIVDPKGMTAKSGATRKPDMKAYSLPKEDLDALVAHLT